MFMQFLIERARRVSRDVGYSPLILSRFENYEFKYSDGLMHKESLGATAEKKRNAWRRGAERLNCGDYNP
jgi:hypothetical protein